MMRAREIEIEGGDKNENEMKRGYCVGMEMT